MTLRIRRFFCGAAACRGRIFTERLEDVAPSRARWTRRLEFLAHCLAIALGRRPAARFARRLSFQISNDTLLRIVRRRAVEPELLSAPSIIGVDDWARRRNHRYGTLICDLERRKTFALLPDREPATLEAWMVRQPQVGVVACNRGGAYAIAARRTLPRAAQVADRWHLMENASQAFLGAVRQSMRQIRTAVGAAAVEAAIATP